MSNMKFTALASLAVLAAPVAAQADMVEMTDTQMADVSGQAAIAGLRWAPFVPTDVLPFFVDGDGINLTPVFNPGNIFNTSFNAAFGVAGDAGNAAIGFGLLPFTGPINAVFGFNDQVLDNSFDFGEGVADIAFMGPFRVLDLVAQGKGTALDFLFFPISAPLDIAGDVFSYAESGVVGTATRILTAPVNFVLNPINRYVDGVTGRAQATVDGAAYAITEVKGALITNAFFGASNAAANNGLAFTSRVFARIGQAQAGLTANRLDAIAGTYGY